MSASHLTAGELVGFLAGQDTEVWRRLGATYLRAGEDTPPGTRFSVWAPNARSVRLVGDFNGWSGEQHELQRIADTGVWQLFCPQVGPGSLYKFDLLTDAGSWVRKADPMARWCESAPNNASLVFDSDYEWGDQRWLAQRGELPAHRAPISIYELHLGAWRQGLGYRELAEQLTDYVVAQGFTHVEFLPVAEHPYLGSWGYHLTGFFAPQSRLGTPDEFRFLIDSLHQAGIGVILDWVPGHFATDEWALVRFDGTPLYEHPDPRRGWHPDWGSYIFDFGRPEVKSFLLSNAWWWVDQFHVDGIRVDAVASMLYLDYSRGEGEWEPNRLGGRENLEAIALLQELNTYLGARTPEVIVIAEESTAFPGVTRPVNQGGLGFSFKWNMGWMNDSLRYLSRAPEHRSWHHQDLTQAMTYAYSEHFILPISHDEVVHGKGSIPGRVEGDTQRQCATVKAFYTFMWTHPGKKLLFMGTEFAQQLEFCEQRSLEWELLEQPAHRGVGRLVRALNRLYHEHPALTALDSDPAGFRWIDADDSGRNVISYLRSDGQGDLVACVINFSDVEHRELVIGLPKLGRWEQLVNTNDAAFDGTADDKPSPLVVTASPAHGFDYRASLSLAPLSARLYHYRFDHPELPGGS